MMPLFGRSRHRKDSHPSRPGKAAQSTVSLVPAPFGQSTSNLGPPWPQNNSMARPITSPPPTNWQYQSAPYLPQGSHQHFPASTSTLPLQHLPAPTPYLAPVTAQQQPPGLQHNRWKSCSNLPLQTTVEEVYEDLTQRTTGYLTRGAALFDLMNDKLNDVITLIDGDGFSGSEQDLVMLYQPPQSGGKVQSPQGRPANQSSPSQATSTNYFSKAQLYANSKLPPTLPTLKLYMPTYPLLCLAAQYSQRVYTRPKGGEKETHVEANCRLGTKAMVIKSVPVDDMNTVVFAIRGSSTFMDWAVNFKYAPASPAGFLDDGGNLCHAGFLAVARKMVRPVAARLRQMLEENPARASCSLLITGHSAGGAVAALLYMHMLSEVVQSELTLLTSCFKRVHCVIFGSPPVSLLPLAKPDYHRLRKSVFLSFINEGDPVTRADKAYIRSLLDLYSSPAPSVTKTALHSLVKKASKSNLIPDKYRHKPKPKPSGNALQPPNSNNDPGPPPAIWNVPPSTLSIAGRAVLLRAYPRPNSPEGHEVVQALVTNDEQMRTVVFGDPVMHMMKIYAKRIEALATAAVTAKPF